MHRQYILSKTVYRKEVRVKLLFIYCYTEGFSPKFQMNDTLNKALHDLYKGSHSRIKVGKPFFMTNGLTQGYYITLTRLKISINGKRDGICLYTKITKCPWNICFGNESRNTINGDLYVCKCR